MSKRIASTIALVLAGCGAVVGQTTFPFTVTVDSGQGSTALANNGTVTLSAASIGTSVSARITIQYTGSSTLSITNVDRSGTSEFSIITPTLPIVLSRNQTADLTVRYLPTTVNRTTGRLTLFYVEGVSTGTFAVNLVGQASNLTFTYTLPGSGAVAVSNGGNVAFPVTRVGASTAATFSIRNIGTAPVIIGSVTSAGDSFTLSGLPQQPFAVDTGREVRFTVNFAPTAAGQSSGTLRIDLPSSSASFGLTGSGTGPSYVYEILRGSDATPITPGQSVSLPDTTVGERTAVTIRVRNAGNAAGTIASVAILGSGYQLGELPFFPLTLDAGQSFSFLLTFAPTGPGRATGRLRVGSDDFDLIAVALGPSFSFSYSSSGVTTPIQNNGTILLSPAQVGSTTTVRFVVQNSGTTAGSINDIVVSSTTAFRLEGLPPLPVSLEANSNVSFDIVFAPRTVGVATTTLQVGTQTFTLSGTGTAPPSVSEFQIEGPTGDGEPLDQPAYGLTLSSAYPLNLTGTLTIGFNSEVFANDPSVQWVSGGRTVAFTIPAGATRAVFPNNTNQIRLQTGSTAGSISITPALTTESGVKVIPGNPPVATLAIPKSAPQIVSAQLASKTSTSFSLLVTGYASGRAISQIELRVTPVAGENISNSTLTLNASSAFLSWYQGTQSQQYGSLFTASLTISVEGSVRSASSLVDAIQSLSVTISNAEGISNAETVNLR